MAKFIEIEGWEYNDGRVDIKLIVNVDHIVKIVVHYENYVEGVEYTLSDGSVFYVSEETHNDILEQLGNNYPI